MSAPEIKSLMQKVATGAPLEEDEIQAALEAMMSGFATPAQMAAFLMALRVRGETVSEITGACRLMRSAMVPHTGCTMRRKTGTCFTVDQSSDQNSY